MIAKQRSGRDKPGRPLSVAAAMRLSGCLVRFLLTAVLSGAEILDGHALFALSAVGVCKPGLEGLSALLGAALGYLTFRGFVEGLRYIAACMMIYAVSLALGEFQIYRRRWFMPAICAALNGLVGFVYQSAVGWNRTDTVGFVTEVVLTAGTVYFFRLAFNLMEENRPGGVVTVQQTVGILVLGAAIMLTLARVTVADRYSLGRVLCVLAVMIAGWKGGVGIGAAAGVAAGLAMDLSSGTAPYYALAYAFPGLVTGIFSGQGKLLCALAYVMSGGAAMLWSGGNSASSHIYEIIAGTVIFLILPDKVLRRLSALIRQDKTQRMEESARQYAARKLGRTAEAFRAVSGDLSAAFPGYTANDGDASRVFDRAAERVCGKCKQRERCWQQEYQSTKTALSDALVPMMDRGEGVREDFPAHFSGRCVQFEVFLRAVNRELMALLYRRRYDSRVQESRAAVCAQYGQLAGMLERTAAELAKEPAVDVPGQRLVRQRMAALGLEGRCTVWKDEYGHLQIEVEGPGAEQLARAEEVETLSALLETPLRSAEESGGMAHLVQKEPLRAVAGVAAADREGQSVSGDAGAWFKDDSGKLNVVLCDGMGSGPEAREDSDCALSLLEKFLRAGLTPEETLSTVGEALALRGEAQGGFTTVDLLQLDLYTGRGAVYKLGAAPTYLKKGTAVERLEGAALPAGVTMESGEPDRFVLKLEAGDCVVMVSDGVTSGRDDDWLKELVGSFDGLSPRVLADCILQESGRREGRGDDRTVMVLKVEQRR